MAQMNKDKVMVEEELEKLEKLKESLEQAFAVAMTVLAVVVVVFEYQRIRSRLSFVGFLLRLLSTPKTSDAIIGDLEERFRIQVEEKGRRAASRWFWREVLHSFFSLALDALKRLSALEKLIERYRRIGS